MLEQPRMVFMIKTVMQNRIIVIILFLFFINFPTYSSDVNDTIYTDIEKAANNMEKVCQLSLYTTFIKSSTFPNIIFKMKRLKRLRITGMECDNPPVECYRIRYIPDEICKLDSLISLSLVMNGIKKIPACLSKMKIKELDLSDNIHIDITGIENIGSLERLNLNGCRLTKFDIPINKLKKLKILGLSENSFSDEEKRSIQLRFKNCKISFE